ncbi:Nn.00g110190.m01.CDS01 [Neocucurbitaria sp. VM-36]
MAPRRGGGSSSGGGVSVSSCPGAFSDTYSQVFFANTVLFFAVFLGISIALCTIRKKSGAGKKILGVPYIFAVFLFLLSYGLDLISSVLVECGTVNLNSYYSLLIASNVFWYVGYWLLLFVIVYVLNTMLRERLGGVTVVFKVIYLAILGLMFALTCGQIGLSCYNLWTQTDAGYDAGAQLLTYSAERVRIAYSVLYFLSVLASGALSLVTVFSLRSRRHATGDLVGWIIALYFAMVLWCILSIVFAAATLQNTNLTFDTSAALSYILNFFQALSFIFLLCIAKHAAWSKTADNATSSMYDPATHQPAYAPAMVPQQQQYAYNAGNTNGQQYYYNQAPVYNGQGGAAPLK